MKQNRFDRMMEWAQAHSEWKRIGPVLGMVIVFVTVVSLMLPAVTMTHKEQVLDCAYQVHKHTKDCYQTVDGERQLTCGYADYVVHVHNDDCYDKDGVLVCKLPEIPAHQHDASCYEEERVLICGQEESEGHVHGDECYNEEGELVCGLEEGEGGHTHTDACYETVRTVTCGQLELHTHDKSCYDKNGELTCGKLQLEEHRHTKDCLSEVDVTDLTEEPAQAAVTAETSDGEEGVSDASAPTEDETEPTEEKRAEASDAAPDEKGDESADTSEEETGADTSDTAPGEEPDETGDAPAEDAQSEQADDVASDDTKAEQKENSVFFTPPAEEETNETMPAQTFEESTKRVTVHVTAEKGTFPAGTTMVVKEVSDKETIKTIQNSVKGDEKQVQAVDISFRSRDGREIEPRKPIRVSMSSELIAKSDDSVIVHVDDEGKANVVPQTDKKELQQDPAKDEAVFDADAFSVYAIVGSITTDYLSVDGKTYEVTVTYGPEAGIPEGAKLKVTEFKQDSEEYKSARNAVLADKKAKGETNLDLDQFGLAALDISILNKDGKEIEPEASVQVDMKIKKLPDVKDLDKVKDTLEIQHHIETEQGVIVDKVFDGGADASFDVQTKESVIEEKGTQAVDPKSVSEKDFMPDEEKKTSELNASFTTEEFSTYTINWYNNQRSLTVHYGYMNGNNFVEFQDQPSPVNVSTSYRTYLIYDFDGYEYAGETYYRTTASNTPKSGGTRIQAQLRYSSSNWRYHNYSTSDSSNGWNAATNGSHIYVIYKNKTITTGGTVTPSTDEDWPEGGDKPQFSKSSTNNGNGTNTISLNIKAAEKAIENKTKANVIVVFDVSGSMGENMNGQTRLKRAQTAVNNLAHTLLNKKDNQGNALVQMSLISFSTSAKLVQEFTDSETTYSQKVNGLSADGGTNWEQALALANSMSVASDAATFVVFVTDGDPTYRLSRCNAPDSEIYRYNRDNRYFEYDIYGEGNDDTGNRNFSAAVEEVKSIVSHNKSFYAIGVSTDVTKVQKLCTDANVSSDNAFLATDSAGLTQAFNSIASSISATLGFGNVAITDGITDLTHVDMKVMQTVDPNSFKYYRYGGANNKYGADAAHKTEWTTREQDGCAAAFYNEETGSVEWNMGSGFQLEHGVTYVVEFRAWPSQEAYDLVAELNNGTKVYASGSTNSITEDQRKQIVELAAPTDSNQGSYALKTNTDEVSATYQKTTKSGDVVTVSDTDLLDATYHEGTIQNMELESMKLSVRKEFEDDLTAAEDRQTSVTLTLKRRVAHEGNTPFTDYAFPQESGTTSSEIVLNADNNWTYSLYVAPGLMVDDVVLEKGYDFILGEPDLNYHYDLIEEIINPMVVDGSEAYIGDGKLLNGEEVNQYTDRCLTAVNRVKSGVDVYKKVVDQDGKEVKSDVEFTIKGRLLGPDGNPYTWSEGDNADKTGAYHKYDQDGNRVVYKGHFADSSNIEFTLKGSENVRFVNVPEGCTFEFDEVQTPMPEGYQWSGTSAVTQHKDGPNGAFIQEGDVQPVVTESKAELSTGVVGNKSYTVTFTNQIKPISKTVHIVKKDLEGNDLENAKFELCYKSVSWQKVKGLPGADDDGTITLGSVDITGTILPDTVYRLTELAAPDGYVIMENQVYFVVRNGEIQLTDEVGNQLKTEDGTRPKYEIENAKVQTTDNVLTVQVKNTPGQELPATGGRGTAVYLAAGLAMMSGSLAALLLRRRQEA